MLCIKHVLHSTCDILIELTSGVVLQIYDLLMLNYVEDDDAMFRCLSCTPFACPSNLQLMLG